MPRYKRSGAFQRWGADDRRLRSPFSHSAGDLPLLKALKGAILASEPPESSECRLIFLVAEKPDQHRARTFSAGPF